MTCIGKLWLAACSSKVWEASASKVSTTLLGATVAVAADPGLLPLSSSDCGAPSPDEAAELRPEPSDSVASGSGMLPCPSSSLSGMLPCPSSSLSPAAEAAELLAAGVSGQSSGLLAEAAELLGATSELLAAPSADSSSADADALAESEPSGSDTASHEDAFSDAVAATEELALGEGLAGALEDIAAGPRRGADEPTLLQPRRTGARRSSPKEVAAKRTPKCR